MEIKDSGQRSQFSTGAQRDCQAGKGRMDLLPFRALIELAKVYEEGAKKYNDNNWRKGIPLSRYVDSGMRHLAKWMIGWRDEPHLAQAAWNIMCLIETSKMIEEGLLPAELNDLPYHVIEQLENPNNIPPLVTADNRAKDEMKFGPSTVHPLPWPGIAGACEYPEPCSHPDCKVAPPVDVEAMEKSLADIEAGRVQAIEKVIAKYGPEPIELYSVHEHCKQACKYPKVSDV